MTTGAIFKQNQRVAANATAPRFRLGSVVHNDAGVEGEVVGILPRFENRRGGQWVIDAEQCYRVEFRAQHSPWWTMNVAESEIE